jgi:hypothetical protein
MGDANMRGWLIFGTGLAIVTGADGLIWGLVVLVLLIVGLSQAYMLGQEDAHAEYEEIIEEDDA